MKRMKNQAVKRIVSFSLTLLLSFSALLFVSCTAVSDNVQHSENEMSGGIYDMAEDATSGTVNDAGVSITVGRKLVKNISLSLETTQFDSVRQRITEETAAVGGYIESSSVSGESIASSYKGASDRAYYTIRVPAESLDTYIDAISQYGGVNVLSKNENVDDITDSYYDIAARIESLEVQHARLLELLSEAQDLSDVITLEERISEIQYELDSYRSTMQRYDESVAYSTVEITLNEVEIYSEKTGESFGNRIKTAFVSSWKSFADGCQNFAVAVIYCLPALLVFAVLALIVLLIVLASKRSKIKAQKTMIAYSEKQSAATADDKKS